MIFHKNIVYLYKEVIYMKKFLMLFALSSIALSSVNDFNNNHLNKNDEKNFEVVSSKLAYSIANKRC